MPDGAPGTTLDLDAYFARIRYAGSRAPTLEALRALHMAHATAVPFENLDILLGRSISLELPDLEAKLVHARRGGYCFEQNTLFAAALRELGFRVTTHGARVRLGATRVTPRTHMFLTVDVEGATQLADVGFGMTGLLEPMPLVTERVETQGAWDFQLAREGDTGWVLRARVPEGWQDQYAFTLEELHPIDYVVASHYTSTYPTSHFVTNLLMQMSAPDVRTIVRNRELVELRPTGRTVSPITSRDELMRIARERFGIVLSTPNDLRWPEAC